MAYDNAQQFMSLVATAAMTNSQYYAVQAASTEGQGRVINNTGTVPLGSLYNEPTSGAAMQIASGHGEVIKFVTGSTAITVGAKVGPNSSGKMIPVTAIGEPLAGVALQASGTANQVIPVHFQPRVLGTSGY